MSGRREYPWRQSSQHEKLSVFCLHTELSLLSTKKKISVSKANALITFGYVNARERGEKRSRFQTGVEKYCGSYCPSSLRNFSAPSPYLTLCTSPPFPRSLISLCQHIPTPSPPQPLLDGNTERAWKNKTLASDSQQSCLLSVPALPAVSGRFIPRPVEPIMWSGEQWNPPTTTTTSH